MNHFLLVGRSRDTYKAGSHYSYTQLVTEYTNNFTYIDGNNKPDFQLSDYYDSYDKVILCNQSHHKYPFKINTIDLIKNKKLMLFTRFFDTAKISQSLTNGFSIYKQGKHKYFFPTITSKYYQYTTEQPKDFCWGYYYRHQNIDSYMYFCDLMNSFSTKQNIYICGRIQDFGSVYSNLSNHNVKLTQNMTEFYSNITAYVMPMSEMYLDPLPHVLIEAVQHGKQIYCPKMPNRTHLDGIDDILSIIQYHSDINDSRVLDNSQTCLDIRNFDKFIKNCIDCKMEYSFDIKKYNTFYDWCSHEL